MKFIINFILFGLIFYGIYLYFPETFQWLASWAESIYSFIQDIYHKITQPAETA